MTKGALYFHFKSRDELAQAVLDEQHHIAVRIGETILAENAPALTTMIHLCGAFGTQLANDQIFRAGIGLTLEASAFGQTVRGPYEDWIDTLGRLDDQGIREGQIRSSVDPLTLARYIVASFTGVQMVSNILTGRDDVMKRIQEMWEILLPGIMHEDSVDDPKQLAGLISRRHPDRRRKVAASA